MNRPVRAGIIGTGFMGRTHAAAIRTAGSQLVGVAGTSRGAAQVLADSTPGAAAFDGLDDLLAEGLDVLHVCTPNVLHPEHARLAIDAGVDVICEKPLATSEADATGLRDAARAAGVIGAVPFVYRYYPVLHEVRARIAQGAQRGNELWLLHGSYLQDWLADRSESNWRVDPERGGATRAFGDIGVHWFDLMEFVTGHRVTEVAATFANAFRRSGGPGENGTEDGAVVTFRTDRGAAGSLVVSQASAGRKNRLWFSFDGPVASYSFDQEAPESVWEGRSSGDNRLVLRDPALPSALRPGLPSGHPQGYQNCFDDFVGEVHAAVAARRSGREQPEPVEYPSFDDGVRAARLADAVVRSSRSGGAAVAVAPHDIPVPSI